MDEQLKAQLRAMGLIDSLAAEDQECKAVIRGWFKSQSQDVPASEAEQLKALQTAQTAPQEPPVSTPELPIEPQSDLQQRHNREQNEARLDDLKASAELVNGACGTEHVTQKMILQAYSDGMTARDATKKGSENMQAAEPDVPTSRIKTKSEGRDRYAVDAVAALTYRANNGGVDLTEDQNELVSKPLWAHAAECLRLSGQNVNDWDDREGIALQAMEMGQPGRHTFFSEREGRQYVRSAGVASPRPGDFPNILSSLANKFLDTIQLDDDYSYPEVSAVLPGGLNDFKPAPMMNKGIVEELDEVTDEEQIKQLGVEEEILSYIFLRRFANKWGWTPVMVANDDLGAFVEGMLGLDEAWQVTQNRLVVDRFTGNEDLLDGNALFSDRTDVGSASNDNDRASGNTPQDSEWEAMEILYADIGGVNTARRVRGTLNTIYVPTGAVFHEAIRYFAPLNSSVVTEGKQANTTANVGLFRGKVRIVPESELRASSTTIYYGLRNPTRLNTATVVRAYFNGYGTGGRRERWYDPETKCTWV